MDGNLESELSLPARRRRSTKFRFLAGLAVATVALLCFEVVTRVFVSQPGNSRFHQINQIVVFLGTQESDLMLDFDPQRFWKLKPNIQINDSNNLFWQGTVSNSLGFRSDEFVLKRDPDSLRVVCFGDSSTFGIGSRMEDTWPSQFEDLIRNSPRFSDAKPVEVINAGVPGYSSYQGLQHMRQEIDRLQPDVVLASYANNDFWHWDQTTDLQHASQFSSEGRVRTVLMNSRLAQVLAGLSDRVTVNLAPHSNEAASPNQHWAKAATSNYISPNEEWTRRVPLKSFRQNVNEMADLCQERQLPLVLVKWPDQPQSRGRWSPRIEYQDALQEIADARNLGIADVVSLFQANRSWASQTYIPNDIVHVNRDGNRLAAEAAYEALCAVLSLEQSSTHATN